MPSEDRVTKPSMIAPSRTALLVIDVQVDFVSPDGAARLWTTDFARFDRPLRNIETLAAAARKAGVPLVFLRVVTRPETDTEALRLLNQRKGHPPDSLAICRAGTQGADYHRVRPQPGDIEIEKSLYSGFVGTDLEARLHHLGVDTLVLSGFTTDCCVDCTARDAFHRNYNVFVVGDACAAYEDELHRGTLAALSRNCALLTDTQAVVDAWS
jgi:biuret amidohydrolase